MVSVLGAIYFPSIERISRRKNQIFSIFWFQGLTAFCHFMLFLQTNEIEKSVSGELL